MAGVTGGGGESDSTRARRREQMAGARENAASHSPCVTPVPPCVMPVPPCATPVPSGVMPVPPSVIPVQTGIHGLCPVRCTAVRRYGRLGLFFWIPAKNCGNDRGLGAGTTGGGTRERQGVGHGNDRGWDAGRTGSGTAEVTAPGQDGGSRWRERGRTLPHAPRCDACPFRCHARPSLCHSRANGNPWSLSRPPPGGEGVRASQALLLDSR